MPGCRYTYLYAPVRGRRKFAAHNQPTIVLYIHLRFVTLGPLQTSPCHSAIPFYVIASSAHRLHAAKASSCRLCRIPGSGWWCASLWFSCPLLKASLVPEVCEARGLSLTSAARVHAPPSSACLTPPLPMALRHPAAAHCTPHIRRAYHASITQPRRHDGSYASSPAASIVCRLS
jgi:hypothetical protein